MQSADGALNRLLLAAAEVEAELQRSTGDETRDRVLLRLRDSVVRPLEQSAQVKAGGVAASGKIEQELATTPIGGSRPDVGSSTGLSERIWEIARAATELCVERPDAPELQEAAAALQDLAIGLAEELPAASRLAELEKLQAGLETKIQVAGDGPYLVTNARNLRDWLGEFLPVRPQMALCRCGNSKIKPLCDGTHARIGFTDAKDPKRVPDRLDTYVGQQVTVLDNRGTCQHSGYCTDRLASVFHVAGEPFVTPSGGRMDEIIHAVRDCPSGALSYAIDGHKARDQVDHGNTREPAIEVSKDGPYRVTGGIALSDGAGNVPRNQGASREHYALCRCGHSLNKPFCSGMHWTIEFRDPVPEPGHEPTVFEWCGGLPALTRMTRLFYEKHVPQDPLLASLFADMSADHPQRVAKWLAEVFGGPKSYSREFGGYPRMVAQHAGKGLTEEQRARWVALLLQSAREAGLPNDAEFRSAFAAYIEWGSRLAVENSQPGAHPPPQMPMPHWEWNTAAGPPGSRVSALAPPSEEPEQPIVLPASGEPVGYEAHIRPLFRSRDRQSMKFAFDLWSHADVSANADAILARLEAGTMPCDGAWPKPKVAAFRRWVEGGKSP